MLPDSTHQQGMLGMRNDSRTDMCTACSMSCSATVPTLTAYKHYRGADAAAGCCISSFKLHCTPQLSGRQQGCHRLLCRCSASLSLHHPCCLQCCTCLLHQFRVAVRRWCTSTCRHTGLSVLCTVTHNSNKVAIVRSTATLWHWTIAR
jgi:hypothetical protein